MSDVKTIDLVCHCCKGKNNKGKEKPCAKCGKPVCSSRHCGIMVLPKDSKKKVRVCQFCIADFWVSMGI